MIPFYKSISGLWQSWTTVPKHDSVFQDQNRSVPRLKYKFFHRHVKHCYSKWIFWETKWNHTCYMSVFKPCETDMNQDSVTDMCAYSTSLVAHRLCSRTVTDLFYKVCKLFGVTQIFIKFTDCTTGLRQTCKTDSVFQVCFRTGFSCRLN